VWVTFHTSVTPTSRCGSSGSMMLSVHGGLIQLSGL
jgi:hypothetical protein